MILLIDISHHMKRFLNYLKLFFAVCILLGEISMWFDALRLGHLKTEEDVYALLFASLLFLIVALLLIFWYCKTKKKLPQLPSDPYHSGFYLRFKRILDFITNFNYQLSGTYYMLYTNKYKDGSFEATQWFVLGSFPIAPLYRNRISIDSSKEQTYFFGLVTHSGFEVHEKVKMSKRLNRYVYLFYYAFFYPMILCPIVFYLIYKDIVNSTFPNHSFWILILFYFLWGILIYAFSEWFNKKCLLRDIF